MNFSEYYFQILQYNLN